MALVLSALACFAGAAVLPVGGWILGISGVLLLIIPILDRIGAPKR